MNMDYKQIVEDALSELSCEITDANDECGGEEYNHSTHEDFIADVLDAAFRSDGNDGSEHDMAAIAGAAVDEFMFSEVLDSVDGANGESASSENADNSDDSDDKDESGESGEDETMVFKFKIDLAEYAKRFGIQLPDDSPDALTDEGGNDGNGEGHDASNDAKDCSCCDTVAEDAATLSYAPNFAPGSLEGQCQTELKDCRAKNPMTCRYHGAKVITTDIEAAISAAKVKAKSVDVELLGVTNVLGKQYLSVAVKIVVKPSKSAKKAINKAMDSFFQLPGVESGFVDTLNGRSYTAPFDIDMLDPDAKARWGRRGEGDDGEAEQETDTETDQGAVVENPIKNLDDAVKSAMSEVSDKGGFASENDLKDAITGAVGGDNASMDYLLHHLGDESPVVAWVVSEQQNDKKIDSGEEKDAKNDENVDKDDTAEVNAGGGDEEEEEEEEEEETTQTESEESPYGNEKQTEFFNKMNDDLPEDTFILSAKLNNKGVLNIVSVDGDGVSTVTCVSPDGTSFTRNESSSEKNRRLSINSFLAQNGDLYPALDYIHKNGGVSSGDGLIKEYLDGLSSQDRNFLSRFGRGVMCHDELLEGFDRRNMSMIEASRDPFYDKPMRYEDLLDEALSEYHQYLDWKQRGGVSFEDIRHKDEETRAKANEVKIGGESYDLEELEANEAGRAAYDDAVAEVEQNGEAVQNFSRGELRNLRKGDILRFDHADSDWSVESYDDKNGEIVVSMNNVSDNPLFTDEEKAEMMNRRFCITEHGWVELNEKKEKKNGNERKTDEGTDKTVGGNEKGKRGGEEELKLESATAEELNDEKKRRQQKAEIERRQEAPLKTGKGEVGQSLLDLGGAEGEDLFNRTQTTPAQQETSKSDSELSHTEPVSKDNFALKVSESLSVPENRKTLFGDVEMPTDVEEFVKSVARYSFFKEGRLSYDELLSELERTERELNALYYGMRNNGAEKQLRGRYNSELKKQHTLKQVIGVLYRDRYNAWHKGIADKQSSQKAGTYISDIKKAIDKDKLVAIFEKASNDDSINEEDRGRIADEYTKAYNDIEYGSFGMLAGYSDPQVIHSLATLIRNYWDSSEESHPYIRKAVDKVLAKGDKNLTDILGDIPERIRRDAKSLRENPVLVSPRDPVSESGFTKQKRLEAEMRRWRTAEESAKKYGVDNTYPKPKLENQTGKPTMTPVEANKVLGMSAALSDSELGWKQRIWASHSKDPKFARMAEAARVILDYRKQKGKADAHSTEVDVKPKKSKQTQAQGTATQEPKNQPSVSQGKGETTQDKPKPKRDDEDDGDNASSAVRKPVSPDKPVNGGAQASVPSSSAPSNVPTDAGFAAWAVDKYGNPMKFETDAEREQSRNFFEYLVKNGKVDGATGEKVKS